MHTTQLQNKIAIVTGGTRGIGKAIVAALAEAGADVAFTYRSSKESADAIVAGLRSAGTRAAAYQSDAADFNQSNDIVQKVIQEFGRIDILVNNAGITKDGLLMRMSEQDWDAVIDTNLKSVFSFTKTIARELASRNIQANGVAPGFVETDMTEKLNEKQKEAILALIPLKRIAKPEEIAGVVRFLASSDADYITGQVFCVDGGMVM